MKFGQIDLVQREKCRIIKKNSWVKALAILLVVSFADYSALYDQQRRIPLKTMAATSLLLRNGRLVLRLEAHLDRLDIMAGINIGLRDIIGSLGAAIFPVLGAREVLLGPRTGSRPRDLTLNAKNVVAHLHTDISQFSPVLTPGVSNDPVSMFLARAIPLRCVMSE